MNHSCTAPLSWSCFGSCSFGCTGGRFSLEFERADTGPKAGTAEVEVAAGGHSCTQQCPNSQSLKPPELLRRGMAARRSGRQIKIRITIKNLYRPWCAPV